MCAETRKLVTIRSFSSELKRGVEFLVEYLLFFLSVAFSRHLYTSPSRLHPIFAIAYEDSFFSELNRNAVVTLDLSVLDNFLQLVDSTDHFQAVRSEILEIMHRPTTPPKPER